MIPPVQCYYVLIAFGIGADIIYDLDSFGIILAKVLDDYCAASDNVQSYKIRVIFILLES